MRVIATFAKDPAAKLDYTIDWSPWLPAGDTITAAVWVVTGATVSASPPPANTTRQCTVWLEAGTVDTDAYATCRVTTTAGRIDERTIRVRITNQ